MGLQYTIIFFSPELVYFRLITRKGIVVTNNFAAFWGGIRKDEEFAWTYFYQIICNF